MLGPIRRDLTIYQGSEFEAVAAFSIDGALATSTDWSVRSQIRDRKHGPTVLAEPVVTIAADGTLTIIIRSHISETWTWTRGHYDVEYVSLIPAGDGQPLVHRVLEGSVVVDRETTMPESSDG